MWELNPPGTYQAPHTGFEDQGIHQHPSASGIITLYKYSEIKQIRQAAAAGYVLSGCSLVLWFFLGFGYARCSGPVCLPVSRNASGSLILLCLPGSA